MPKTAETATGFHGDKLYQRRAREALPILVRQAKAGVPVVYEDLAEEMRMANPRNLNYPLGCIGDALNDLSRRWRKKIPHIQALVVNKGTGLPGKGFDGFFKERGQRWKTPQERRAVIETYWSEITAFPYWDQVLIDLGLTPPPVGIEAILETAAHRGGGEGPEHIAMKELIREKPYLAGYTGSTPTVRLESPLPSGDCVDVMLQTGASIYAVEVKPARAPEYDIARGLFQCVKYQAVLEAEAAFKSDSRPVTVVLALGGPLPDTLIPLRNSLGVKVFDRLRP